MLPRPGATLIAPWSQAALRALELADEQARKTHDNNCMAARLGADAAAVRDSLSLPVRIGQIVWDGTHWQLGHVLATDLRGSAEAKAGTLFLETAGL